MDETVPPHCHAAYYGWNCSGHLKEIINVTHMPIAKQRLDKHLPVETDSW
jgi:hypothetical protein